MMRVSLIVLNYILLFVWVANATAQTRYDSYKSLVMAGYQGWFDTPDDGSNRGWRHYSGKNGFRPGSASVDFWPDVSEYPQLYRTEFKHQDGRPAYVFSSHDFSTVDTHFKWMKEYGIDGVFMQRFVGEVKNPNGKRHFNHVLNSATQSATKYDRAICIMYDLSGMRPGDETLLLTDIDELEGEYRMKERKIVPSYLYHNGKPLVVVWGVGFNSGRSYGFDEVEKLIDGLKDRGYSVMLGVPTYWREFGSDTKKDETLHRLIKKSDLVMPWFVGRYNEKSYDKFKSLIKKDMEWCSENKVDYVPLCFPGFSWENLKGRGTSYIDRNSGSFFWKQLTTVIDYGAEMIYIAMFDEIDEGTAIFKCARQNEVPLNGEGMFRGIENNLPSDHYLWLTGEAAKMLRKEKPLHKDIPVRK